MPGARVQVSTLAPGVRLYRLPTRHLATTICRVVLSRDLGSEATATSVLASVLQSATARHPTRQALAWRLADLYGAALHVAVGRMGDRQTLSATLEWPTASVPAAARQREQGLALLAEVLTDPLREVRGAPTGPLDHETVATERENLRRSLRGERDDKARYAFARALRWTCRAEPHALEPTGCEEHLAGVTPAGLDALHRRLLATAPMDIYLVGDWGAVEARQRLSRHLLWPRARRSASVPPAASVRAAPARPRRRQETDDVKQSQVVLTWRGRVPPTNVSVPVARTLAGVLGQGSTSRLFRVMREKHALCYFADASWNAAKGYLSVQTAVDPGAEERAVRMARRLQAEVAGGHLEPAAWHAWREAVERHVDALADDPAALVGWVQARAALGLSVRPADLRAEMRGVTEAAVRRLGRRLRPVVTFLLTPERSRT